MAIFRSDLRRQKPAASPLLEAIAAVGEPQIRPEIHDARAVEIILNVEVAQGVLAPQLGS